MIAYLYTTVTSCDADLYPHATAAIADVCNPPADRSPVQATAPACSRPPTPGHPTRAKYPPWWWG